MANAKSSGLMIAGAVAALFATGSLAPTSAHADDAQVECMGVNACKGQSDCKTAQNACKGQNSCKGEGFTKMSAEDCEAAGGTVGE